MKVRNYMVTVLDKAEDFSRKNAMALRFGGVSGLCAGIMANPAIQSFASEVSGGSGSIILDDETLKVIMDAFGSLGVTATAIIIMGMTATVSVMLLSQACDYALKRMKAAFKKAA